MSWALLNTAGDFDSASLGSIATVDDAFDAAVAGSLRVLLVAWETGTDVLVSGVADSGSNAWAATSPRVTVGGKSAQLWYRFGGATGAVTVTATWAAAVTWRSVQGYEFTHDGTGVFDATPTNGGSSGSSLGPALSGNVTAASGNLLAFSGVRTNTTVGGGTRTINGVTPDGATVNGSSVAEVAYRLNVTGPFTGQASHSIGSNQDWICLLATFKEVAAGGGAVPVKNMVPLVRPFNMATGRR